MDYNAIKSMANAGIAFFADQDGGSEFDVIISGGGIKIDPKTGDEIEVAEERGKVFGVIRDVRDRDVDGESILADDKRGIFQDPGFEIKKGMIVIVDGVHYSVVVNRRIKPGSTIVAYRPILRQVAVNGG